MASPSLRLSPSALHCVSRRSVLAVNSRRNVLFSIRLKSTTASQGSRNTLPWSEYLAIRRGKRKWEMALTIPCVLAGLAGGAAYFGSMELDATKPIMGIDPLLFFGGATLGCMGMYLWAGYLVGPILGSNLWRVTHRRTMALIEERDREFHRHIVKNRVDPRAQSATNPVPDFYGEKIGSLHQYRQWLRDQARYKRKAQWPEDQP
ncbi:mitochondrial import protein Pam17 [Russula ochroleuca]|uniref:Presequence translocated-associated motor subunit PAM17 n=1 Tax=Russula ochroleuca TaxID=152965 RepID=A0A9P5MV27_9AGAM|nr:mitochondrial import protein Pam17 [Russula ochroleuca]